MSSSNEPFISIIMPIYQVEKYLREALDSILNQSYRNYEILLIDDGSTDGCPAICDEYAAEDKRIKAIHKANGGLSDARNAGILAACGKYLLFIDGDDFIAGDSLINLVQTIENDGETDVVLLNIAHYYNDGTIKKFRGYFQKNMLYQKTHKEALEFLTSMSDFATSACLKLIKRELLICKEIFFRKVLWCEDTDFSMKLYLQAKTYNYCASYLYYYRKERNGSATYSFSEKKYKDLLYVISQWMNEVRENSQYYPYTNEICSYFSFQYCLLISGYHKISPSARKSVKDETRKYAWLLKSSKNSKVAMVRAFYGLFGLRLTSVVLNLYERLKNVHLPR